jgi:light-regulated signal transduction histidine kinase (bacteriophytochrome)/CheY-like chemotaxis protein
MVEDEAHDATLVQHTLRSGGFDFSFRCVDTEKEFLDELEHFHPSLILSDHGLPSFDGFTALNLAQAKAPDVPFIFVTGSLGEEMAIKALKNGASDFVLKHRLSGLPSAVHRALRQAENRVQRRDAEAALQHSEERYRLLAEDLERRVRTRTAELEAANKELEAFSYSVSHDLRAPLRHIEGFVDILRTTNAGLLDEEGQRYLEMVAKSAAHMSRLIDDLLDFSRAGRAEIHRSRINLNDLITAILRELEFQTRGREIEWVVGRLPRVQADGSLLRQVFANLLHNAVKYTQKRPLARIEIQAQTTPEEYVISVQDNGVGFDSRYAHKLFGVFQRLHKSTDFEGTGVGLANVRRIITRHGGRAWAESTPDKGATFYISLPRLEKPGRGERDS